MFCKTKQHNWARRQLNAQSLELCFPKAHKKRKRTIYQTIPNLISISVKHQSLWFMALSLRRTMIWEYLSKWHEFNSLKQLPFSGITQVYMYKRVCLPVPPLRVILKFLTVWQSYHCNHQTHTWLQFDHMVSSNGRREKKESRASDGKGKTNKVELYL